MKNLNIVLCGFMGCGKSTVGKLLAERLGYTFVDMDAYIEAAEKRSVSDIFATDGEAYFRLLEQNACRTLAARHRQVIATGGGAMLFADNRQVLRQSGILVWLKVGADCVLERLQDDVTRPLLQTSEKDRVVREMLAVRDPFYANADLCVDAERTANVVADDVFEQVNAVCI